ncbi:MAG: hypothetical protein CSA81_01775 [Acidobacteria bacterium]|nr:MAG: hypothetical protein CSA81_01775 [Acidobacteriota bacterium]
METAPPPHANLFASQSTLQSADCVILPVPWDATSSYGTGSSQAPEAIRTASHQMDFFDLSSQDDYSDRVYMMPVSAAWEAMNRKTCDMVAEYRQTLSPQLQTKINHNSEKLNAEVEARALEILHSGKKLGLLGGDHSTPFGAIKALSTGVHSFGILHIDAHHDLREAYEGLSFSHASIFHQVLRQISQVQKLVSVGVRDFSAEEFLKARDDSRVRTFYDTNMKKRLYKGTLWHDICQETLNELPENIYISLDIDGLDPQNCPHTGTPVPGGLSYDRLMYLLEMVKASRSKLIGFDLCEVSPDRNHPANEWDANVGARVLYKLVSLLLLHR